MLGPGGGHDPGCKSYPLIRKKLKKTFRSLSTQYFSSSLGRFARHSQIPTCSTNLGQILPDALLGAFFLGEWITIIWEASPRKILVTLVLKLRRGRMCAGTFYRACHVHKAPDVSIVAAGRRERNDDPGGWPVPVALPAGLPGFDFFFAEARIVIAGLLQCLMRDAKSLGVGKARPL